MTYAQQIAARFPTDLAVIASHDTVSLIWAGYRYNAVDIAEFAGVDDDMVIVGSSQMSLEIPSEIANETVGA
jgi:hypothetical protein